MKQRITILGSTGSIGVSTLDVLARHPDRFEVFALSAATRVDLLLAQCAQFRPRFAVMSSGAHARLLAEKLQANGLPTQLLLAPDALEMIAAHAEVDAVMAAIVGAVGLAPCLAAARAGKRLLLANKEALVVGGGLFMRAVREGGATLLPIDSEHSAIFQCLPEDPETWPQRVDSILLTASGGPLRGCDPALLAQITPAQACAHPNFSMGRKISVDSATMMNKALEVIEARWLFDLRPEQIKVVIHPQQIIHSMVQFRDASILAQLGTPDMRVPIACGLAWPERIASGASRLDFSALGTLAFEDADAVRFPGLHLSWQTLNAAEGTAAVLNAANEVAVAAFLSGRLRFDHIHAVNLATLDRISPYSPDSLEALLSLDAQARCAAEHAAGLLAA
ncbi:1-deoxy-D-xylulose-5-phosphate reductoisomerase [Verminephrobacter aporrectodeae subsp. tuberculatae]|uniref:1-deoxy-D-xylulose 5-phosphate reductoisomerase n=1 Tax=Verminephrobacter aporrectodeae subsp. tuberculatae TaxID=1110392 RepID=A0ABT3KR13_9BURK|nr:1-deoxy-D-xylulose-5-phosphate reductoisomerase [Verminephrobacter aporrectodeae]MCW5220308.1 1-deoxy-D-xylulose-5-phosphate reductoisomerase [Verminephrobacter aporrectodeae subsp. tuberculatae]MCW5289602.1 1-deoxy-D-xylulose-5-phosphate reductoisomerase [Verminephrobacter aporrectodeae subsp. tuberculatae]MCW5320741.1 1-deoxy-D-xylulose-5-phosphate reductoisomerase [Verminephrobacter aporrectodeae subsp. tuberculatae]